MQRHQVPLGIQLGGYPVQTQIDQPRQTHGERDQAHGSQHVLRPLAEAGEKLDGQQIEETLDDAAHAVLRAAELARPVVDRDFADRKPRAAASTGTKRCSSP